MSNITKILPTFKRYDAWLTIHCAAVLGFSTMYENIAFKPVLGIVLIDFTVYYMLVSEMRRYLA